MDGSFRPAATYRSLHEQIAHILAARESIVGGLSTGDFNWKSDYAEYQARSIDEMLAAIEAADAKLQGVVEMNDERWLAEVVPPLSRTEWLWAMLEHEIHHVGQISMTIHLAGGRPAAIFE